MASSSVLSPTPSVKSSSVLSTREFLIRTKTSRSNINNQENIIALRIFDNTHHSSEEVILKQSERQNQSIKNKNIDIFHIRTQQKLDETIRKLKLHTTNIGPQRSENKKNERIFLKWIELTDLNTKRTFCFPVDDYLPSSSGDALELTEVHEDTICETNDQQESDTKYFNVEKSHTSKKITDDRSQSIRASSNSSKSDTNSENKTMIDDQSKYVKLYDIRTKTAHQGFLGIKSSIKANVFLKFHDINHQSSQPIPLIISKLHERPFRSNQTDQFQVGTMNKLDSLKKVEMWHDGKKGTRLHCDTLEITDRTNGQIYCFQIKGEFRINYSHIIINRYI
jgi:hypothetical protein